MARAERRKPTRPYCKNRSSSIKTTSRLNESAPIAGGLEPTEQTLRELGAYYRPHNERLFRLIGRDLGWHDDARFPWYREAS